MVRKCIQAILGVLLLVSASFLIDSTSAAAAYEEYGIIGSDDNLDRGAEIFELEYEDNCQLLADADWKLLRQPKNPELLKQWVSVCVCFSMHKIHLLVNAFINQI